MNILHRIHGLASKFPCSRSNRLYQPARFAHTAGLLSGPNSRGRCSRQQLGSGSHHGSLGKVCAIVVARPYEEVNLLRDAVDETEEESEFEEDAGATSDWEGLVKLVGLALPEVRLQKRLSADEIRVQRSMANSLASKRRLARSQIGQKGITKNFLCSTMDILMTHSLVRVQLGSGCSVERHIIAKALEQLLDCICVLEVGYTVTLYRQPGLPRPANVPCLAKMAQAAQAHGQVAVKEPTIEDVHSVQAKGGEGTVRARESRRGSGNRHRVLPKDPKLPDVPTGSTPA